jgi:hypothetical protein
MANKELMNTFFLGLLLPLLIISCNALQNKASSINYMPVDNNRSSNSSLLSVDGQNITSTMTFPTNPRTMIESAIDQIRNSTGSGGHNNLNNNTNSSIVRDSATVLLGMKVIPARDFIPLYDSNPYKIMNGHLTAKLPCDLKSESQLQILIGHIPNLKAVQLELVKELSKPGYTCLYQQNLVMHKANTLDVNSSSKNDSSVADNMILFNPTNGTIKLPHTSTVIIGVDEISS